MNDFVKHEPCPECGGSDPLARYTDGHAYCFSCGYYEKGSKDVIIRSREPKADVVFDCPLLPPDRKPIFQHGLVDGNPFARNARDWLLKYGITKYEAQQQGFTWSPQLESLIMPVYDNIGDLKFWQSKCYHPKKLSKYLTAGRKEDYDLILGDTHNKTVVLVEDYLSAIKVGRVTTVVPLFGSDISIGRRSRLVRKFDRIVLWLDADKFFYAMDWRKKTKPWFDDITCIRSAFDPKSYTEREITLKLQGLV